MSISYFYEKSLQPSINEIESILGKSLPFWKRLTQFIDQQFQMPADLSYGGRNYGWNFWYRNKGKSLISLYPQEDQFIAQVILGRVELEKAISLTLGENVGKMVLETPMFHDGKWLFVPVKSEIEENDIEQLLLIKKRPIKQKSLLSYPDTDK
ncbi:MAG TPA: DUF3788 domain-containing protein [Anaerolineaceae bacterium]|nr:DUF3788 domain-containing protein [Anaerolineaceae bacterium]